MASCEREGQLDPGSEGLPTDGAVLGHQECGVVGLAAHALDGVVREGREPGVVADDLHGRG
ncbi:MAG: hypothetical protein U5J98_00080 [Halobacteriales archaeon]|nr:hypothetical protein [Halobacteriales archaeon]